MRLIACNVAFIASLMGSSAGLVAADMPIANRLTTHILAVAEHEREMIFNRTKLVLAQARARGHSSAIQIRCQH